MTRGACRLLQAAGLNILIDCGAVQGNDRAVAMEEWPVAPAAIERLSRLFRFRRNWNFPGFTFVV